jgi:hypothetical protein
MAKAKRKNTTRIQPDRLAKRLVAAWRNDDVSGSGLDEYEVFDEILQRPNPDQIIVRAAYLLPEEDRLDFTTDMYDIAANDCRTLLVGTEKISVESELHLFTVVVRGTEDEIDKFVKSEVFTKVAKLIRASGLAHGQSNVALCPLPISAPAASDAGPSDVRRVLEALWDGVVTGHNGGLVNKVAACLGLHDSDLREAAVEPGSIRVVTRLFVGARLLPFVSESDGDLFSPPHYDSSDLGGDANDEVFFKYEADKGEASIRFSVSAHDLFESNNLSLYVDGPFEWAEGLGMVALNHLLGELMLEALISGLDSSGKADEAHVATTKDEVFVVFKYGSTFVGPVSAPMHMAQYAMDAITDWLSESAGAVFTYQDVQTFHNAIRQTAH